MQFCREHSTTEEVSVPLVRVCRVSEYKLRSADTVAQVNNDRQCILPAQAVLVSGHGEEPYSANTTAQGNKYVLGLHLRLDAGSAMVLVSRSRFPKPRFGPP